ncbi:hypothetical protein [Nonomuraea longispora]|nr:hypothetical protein [Nonomuraea longispora]
MSRPCTTCAATATSWGELAFWSAADRVMIGALTELRAWDPGT